MKKEEILKEIREHIRCPLCEALKNEKHLFLYENNELVILPTKTKKGHHKRVMILSKEHKRYPQEERKLLNTFQTWCKSYFDEEPTFAICDPKYASFPEHWHRIACDWFGTPAEKKQLKYTPHVAYETYVEWKP